MRESAASPHPRHPHRRTKSHKRRDAWHAFKACNPHVSRNELRQLYDSIRHGGGGGKAPLLVARTSVVIRPVQPDMSVLKENNAYDKKQAPEPMPRFKQGGGGAAAFQKGGESRFSLRENPEHKPRQHRHHSRRYHPHHHHHHQRHRFSRERLDKMTQLWKQQMQQTQRAQQQYEARQSISSHSSPPPFRLRDFAFAKKRGGQGRGGGSNQKDEEDLPGQVPSRKNPKGQMQDIETLNRRIEAVAKSRGVTSWPRYTVQDWNQYIATFSLAAEEPNNPNHTVGGQTLLRASHLHAQPPQIGGDVQQAQHMVHKELSQCETIERNQKNKVIHLHVHNLLTLFRERWLDSVVIDAYIHTLLEAWKQLKPYLYVNSAEHDATLDEIVSTPPCYSYVLVPLYLDYHWTVLFIDHLKRRIYYLNSQVPKEHRDTTPHVQTDPFHRLFPDYKVEYIISDEVSQCDNSSCGVYVCFWAYAFLYQRNAIRRIQCTNMDQFRAHILDQLIISYVLSKK